MGPDELFQRAVIARRYYLEGRTRVEIAEEFGLSRFKVARMLEEALESRSAGNLLLFARRRADHGRRCEGAVPGCRGC